MRILTGRKIQEADRVTALRRHITGLELMEEASRGLAEAVADMVSPEMTALMPMRFLIGKGNNGGDGLAVARMLCVKGYRCEVVMTAREEQLSEDAAANYRRLPGDVAVLSATDIMDRGEMLAAPGQVVIDALLGSGVSGPVREPLAGIVRNLNAAGAGIISIDMPSGLPTEPPEDIHPGFLETVVKAGTTLTIGFPKLSLLLPETGNCGGRMVVTPLGLDGDFIASSDTPYEYTEEEDIRRIVLPRAQFSHKGDFGHALLVCGSAGMAGASVLAARGALRSGCGLVTVHLPGSERAAVHCTCPSAMVDSDPAGYFSVLPGDMKRYAAVGCGCGLGQREETVEALKALLSCGLPMVLDADALNIIASRPGMLDAIPRGSVLTPHLGELKRLTGDWKSPYDRLAKASGLAMATGSCVVVKGARTAVISPSGQIAFNSTGNPGMAKGGSGDVLTGLTAGLLASGHAAFDAARAGVWLHGRAGDIAASRYGESGMNSGDLAGLIGEAFLSIGR